MAKTTKKSKVKVSDLYSVFDGFLTRHGVKVTKETRREMINVAAFFMITKMKFESKKTARLLQATVMHDDAVRDALESFLGEYGYEPAGSFVSGQSGCGDCDACLGNTSDDGEDY